jgi:hypothetical protein
MKKAYEINAKQAMSNDYRERHNEERKMQSYFNLDNYRIFIKGFEVGSFYELPFVAFERVEDTYYPYIDAEFKDTAGNYHNYKSLYDGGKVTFYERKTEDTEDAGLTLAHGITCRKPAADLEDLEDMAYEYDAEDAEDAEETKKSHWTYDYRPLKRRYTKEAVEAAEAVLKEWNVPVKYTGRGNYRKIEDICNAAAEAQNGFVSFPIICGIENNATYHAF